jgi:hypothetical protein
MEGMGEAPRDGEVVGLEVGADYGVAGTVERAGDGEAFGHAEAGYEDGFGGGCGRSGGFATFFLEGLDFLGDLVGCWVEAGGERAEDGDEG